MGAREVSDTQAGAIIAIVAVAAIATFAEPISAQEPPDAGSLTEAQRSELGQLFARAKKAWEAENYLEAIVALEAAYVIFPEPNILHRIGEAHENVGDLASASTFYRRYVEAAPQAKDAGLVRKRVEDIERRIADLQAQRASEQPEQSALLLDTNPEGAIVRLDDKQVPGRTPVRVELDPGTHRVELRRDGFHPVVRNIEIDAGETISLVYQLDEIAAQDGPKRSAWPWVVGGVGVASLGASVGFLMGFRAADQQVTTWDDERDAAHALGSDVLERPDDYDATVRRSVVFRNLGIGAAGVGVLGVATGVVWLIARGGKKQERQQPGVVVGPAATGVALRW